MLFHPIIYREYTGGSEDVSFATDNNHDTIGKLDIRC